MRWKVQFNGTFFIILIFVFLIIFISFVFYTTEVNTSNVFMAQGGSLHIPYETFEDTVFLNGEWQFYEKKYVNGSTQTGTSSFVEFPHINETSVYGTYALEIQGLKKHRLYAIHIPDNGSAYKLYLNDELLASSGQIAENKEDEKMMLEPKIITFMAPSETFTLYYQLSSFHTFPSGFIKPLTLGLPETVIKTFNRKILAQMVLFGAIAIIGLYNLSLFLLNTKELSALFFALFNFAVAIRLLITGERLINLFLHNPNWEILFAVLFISGSLMLAFFSYFIFFLFNGRYHKLFLQIITLFTLFLTTSVFIFPRNILSLLDNLFFVATILTFVYILFIQIKLMMMKVLGSNFAFMGSIFLISTVILDLFLPSVTNIVPIGIIIFLIFYSLVISEKYTFIYEQNILLNQVAIRDGMTNLYKKDHFKNLVENIISKVDTYGAYAMMFIDIDDFKSINDNYGHDIGDEVIINIAQRLIQSLSYSDIACRFGGDEFVVWLQDTDIESTKQIADRILKNIIKPIRVDKYDISVSVSIGVSHYDRKNHSFEALIAESDRRMYMAKAEGKNRYTISG